MQQESPRQCKICGGPNHYGCGCEARLAAKRQLSEAKEAGLTENEAKALQEPEPQPADAVPSESDLPPVPAGPQPAEPKPAPEVDDDLEDILGTEALRQAHQATLQMQMDVKMMADGFETLCASLYDSNNYLKLIAGDMITIRKFLTKEDEPKKADRIKTIDDCVGCICTIQGCIEQHLNTIPGLLKEITERMDKDVAGKNQD